MVAFDDTELRSLARQLNGLCAEMLKLESALVPDSVELNEAHRASARNLAHYLALRSHDIREIQTQLASLGLSSLGRTEGHVMSGVRAVLTILDRLGVKEATFPGDAGPQIEFGEDRRILERNTSALLGPTPADRRVRIMVTSSPEAATDYDLVLRLLTNGMDCMRINCAHDGEDAWAGMIRNLKRAREETGRPCELLMDLAGPKLRTGPLAPGPAVLKVRPQRDDVGRVLAPANVWLVSPAAGGAAGIAPSLGVAVPVASSEALGELKRGDAITFRDARGSRRTLEVVRVEGDRCLTTLDRTAYFVPELELRVRAGGAKGKGGARLQVGALPPRVQRLLLKPGETLILTRTPVPGRPPRRDKKGRVLAPARIGVTLPKFLDHVRVGEPIWFDDGKIGGVIHSVDDTAIVVEISQARPEGEWLGSEKGINLPETHLEISALTEGDLATLRFIARHADLVGYSFVRTEDDVRQLQGRLSELGGDSLGIVLKIETRESFEALPRLILAAMRSRTVGIMIARGDLAVECGYERLAELQEEILWIAEAAHLPVVWATQVLERLAKTGMPSRSEITDAAVGERAECVMLNKGPYAARAVSILDGILRRMEAHQEKKRSMLRQLRLATAFATPGDGSGWNGRDKQSDVPDVGPTAEISASP